MNVASSRRRSSAGSGAWSAHPAPPGCCDPATRRRSTTRGSNQTRPAVRLVWTGSGRRNAAYIAVAPPTVRPSGSHWPSEGRGGSAMAGTLAGLPSGDGGDHRHDRHPAPHREGPDAHQWLCGDLLLDPGPVVQDVRHPGNLRNTALGSSLAAAITHRSTGGAHTTSSPVSRPRTTHSAT